MDFPKEKRPPAAGALSWSQPAGKLDALVRTLDFGHDPNLLGLPKLVVGKEIYIISGIDVLDLDSPSPPGTILSIDENQLTVAAADHPVRLTGLRTVTGQPVSVADLRSRHGLEAGSKLPELDAMRADALTKVDEAVSRHEPYWLNRLLEIEPVEIPYAHHAGDLESPSHYSAASFSYPAEVQAFLKAMDPDSQISYLLTAFAAYLARVSNRYTFDIGVRQNGMEQDLAELEGFFASHVPLRIDIDPSAEFETAWKAIRDQLAIVSERQTYASDIFLRYPELETITAQKGKFAFPVVVERGDQDDGYRPQPGSQLTAFFSETGSSWLFDNAGYSEDSIEQMQQQFRTYLLHSGRQRDELLKRIPLLPESEAQRILVEWNDTGTDYADGRCLHTFLETQAEKNPDAPAVVFEGEQLTYRQLNQRANQMAHYLQGRGVGLETLVGVFMERSLELLVSIYAILKAGGAYVPLDPEYPPERIAYMLEDTRVPVLITQERLADMLPEHGAEVICADADWQKIAAEDTANLDSGVTPDNLAYIIYTSGSTGKPKGVLAHHRGMSNHILWMQDTFGLTEQDRNLHKTPICSVVSVWELFTPASVGARLVVAKPGGHRDSAYLVNLIAGEQVTTSHFVPSMMRAFLDEQDVEKCSSLKRVVSSGEALPHDLQQHFFSRLDAELFNLYGQSETACDITFYHCQRNDERTNVPIGRPLANTSIYLLDPQMQPVPVGASGELYAGGVNIARGYHNRPDLTAERFIPDPFSNDPASRLYRSGDLARYLPDGNIEFLGRADFQVKIRGFRVELGEIEAALMEHPAVREAVALLREDIPGDKRLVAYLVLKDASGQQPTVREWQDHVRGKLPDYMVPGTYVVIDKLPLTPNGKTNRLALPAPGQERPNLAEAYVAPRSQTEEVLTTIMSEVIGIETIGIHDNFFDLGANSLLCVQATERVKQACNIDFSVIKMFQYPTVSALAEYLSEQQGSQLDDSKVQERAQRRNAAALRRRRTNRQR